MKNKMTTNGWLFIIGAKTNTPLWNVKEIFKIKFNNDKNKLKDLETYLLTN
tara:strand:- start:205 stop:357 length:153 start_codon:yes stop_codon:yes gene_type:complete